MIRTSTLICLFLLTIGTALAGSPVFATNDNAANEVHWASAGCTSLSVGPYSSHNEKCHMCVEKTKGHGDPTRCHQCLRPHHGHLAEEMVQTCLECVSPAEHKRLGWACTQYCTHHGIVNDRTQALSCIDCLMAPLPKDKWGCHVCLEQVDKDMVARNDCFKCLSEGKDHYECAYCGRVEKQADRAECYSCMASGKPARECAGKYGVGVWIKPAAPVRKPAPVLNEAGAVDHSQHIQ